MVAAGVQCFSVDRKMRESPDIVYNRHVMENSKLSVPENLLLALKHYHINLNVCTLKESIHRFVQWSKVLVPLA